MPPMSQESSADQSNEQFVEPSRDEIPGISRQHVEAMESSNADEVWILAGMHHVVLTTIGRKSGKVHKVALPYWLDAEGRRIVVASFSGAPKHPSWFVNLRDRTANPEVHVRVQNGEFWAEAQILDGDDYDRAWAGLTADRAYYDDYQSRTDRRIPLVRLVERRNA